MCRAIEISLPLPPRELHPNASGQKRYKAKPTKKCREWAYLQMRSEFVRLGYIEMWKRATWQATYTLHANTFDEDGLVGWCKAYLDGAVKDARLLPDDGRRYLTMARPPVVKVDKTAVEGVVLRFEEVVG